MTSKAIYYFFALLIFFNYFCDRNNTEAIIINENKNNFLKYRTIN